MTYTFLALAVSFLLTLAVIRMHVMQGESRAARAHGFGRAGGIGVAAGLLASLLARLLDDAPYAQDCARMGLALLASAAPVCAAGLLDDFTQRVSVKVRLAAALVSAVLAGWLLGAWVERLDVPMLDAAIAVPGISIVFTCLLVAGLTNAFNIIDGFNGLAGGVASIILLGTAYVAFKVGDVLIVAAAVTAVGAIAGFMLLNFPRGLIYLGDNGAYLLGFWIAVLEVLLVGRHPEVSAWFPVLLCAYPVCEVLFSIYRRAVVRRAHPGLPDVAHLHHLIYKRLVRWLIGTRLPVHRMQRNSLTAPYLWLLTSIGVAPAVLLWQMPHALQIGSALFAGGYIYAYARIVRFRAPRWWVLRKIRQRPPSASEHR
ncbi:MAG: glycosyltransferase [Burkholderiales bacterium]